MSDYGDEMPPAEAEGLDRPSENEDALDDTSKVFNGPVDDDAEKLIDSDDESLLSDVDEEMLEEFDANKVLADVAPDFDALRGTKIQKRKRDENDEGRPKKKKERTRERARRRRGEEEVEAAPADGEVGARRPRKAGGGERRPRERVEIDEDTLPPEERRRRALDRAMDAAVKKSSGKRLRKGEIVCSNCDGSLSAANVNKRTSNKWLMRSSTTFATV